MRRASALVLLASLLAVLLAGCGRRGGDEEGGTAPGPAIGQKGTEEEAAEDLGFPLFATKNTTRVGSGDPIASAAAIARAAYPAGANGASADRAQAVAVADAGDWRVALAASVLMARPVRAPLLLSQDGKLPPASAKALEELAPRGSEAAAGAQVVRVGARPAATPSGLKATDVRGKDPFAIARGLDAFMAAAQGQASDAVLVVSAEAPEYAMPAAGYAAKEGIPILFTRKDSVPADTRSALRAHDRPRIYVLGPSKVVSRRATQQLRKLGTVTRVGGQDPISNAVEFAAFTDGRYGWGVADAGHGLVFVRSDRTLDAAAAAPLSASGKYGPLILLDDDERLPSAVESYLLDIQPGYSKDPVRAFYNHGWVVGDAKAVGERLQARIDGILEIRPVSENRSRPAA